VNLRFTLDEAATVDIQIFSLTGRMVWETKLWGNAGRNETVWPAVNLKNAAVASGAYVCRISDGKHSVTRKIFIAR